MSIKDDLKYYITESGWSLTKVVSELNKRNGTNLTVQNLSKKINNETIRYSEILEIAEIIGCKIKWEHISKIEELSINALDLNVMKDAIEFAKMLERFVGERKK